MNVIYDVKIYHSALFDAATSLFVGFVEHKNVANTQSKTIRLEVVSEQFSQSTQEKSWIFSPIELKATKLT